MMRSYEVIVDKNGEIHLKEPIQLPYPCRAILTIFEDIREDVEAAVSNLPVITLMSEAVLAEDWNRPEEDVAWSHLKETL